MNPNGLSPTPEQTSSGGLNIDQMLQTLEQPTPVVEAQIQEPAPIPQAMDITPPIPQESSPVPTFSVESFTQPTVMDTTSTIIEPKVSIAPKKKSSVMPAGLRVVASGFLTLLVFVVGGWVFSKQYPVETTNLLNSITGIFSNITSTTKNNINPDGIVVLDEDEDTTHGVADGESPYELETPLADAMDNANSTGPVENQAEELFDNVLSGSNETNSIDFSSGSSVLYNSGTNISGTNNSGGTPVSNYGSEITFPTTQALPTAQEFQSQLSELSEQSQSAMTNLIGNNDASLAKMRVVYKNVQAMIAELSTSQQVTDTKLEQYNQMKSLYDSVNK